MKIRSDCKQDELTFQFLGIMQFTFYPKSGQRVMITRTSSVLKSLLEAMQCSGFISHFLMHGGQLLRARDWQKTKSKKNTTASKRKITNNSPVARQPRIAKIGYRFVKKIITGSKFRVSRWTKTLHRNPHSKAAPGQNRSDDCWTHIRRRLLISIIQHCGRVHQASSCCEIFLIDQIRENQLMSRTSWLFRRPNLVIKYLGNCQSEIETWQPNRKKIRDTIMCNAVNIW